MLEQFLSDYRALDSGGDHDLADRLDRFAQAYAGLPKEPRKPATFLEVVGRTRHEVTYSRVLAYFLDPNAPHGLGCEFLNAFLSALGRDEQYQVQDADSIVVETEVPMGDRRADIVLTTDNLILVVENKIDAPESPGQTRDLFRYGMRADFLKGREGVFVLLSPDGRPARSQGFLSLAYPDILKATDRWTLEVLADAPSAPVQQFLGLMRTIKEEFVSTKAGVNIFDPKAVLYMQHYQEIHDVWLAYQDALKKFRGRWEEQLRGLCNLAPDEWDTDSGGGYFQVFRPGWKTDTGVFVHYEFWIYPDMLNDDEFWFGIDVEGKRRQNFFDEVPESRVKATCEKRGMLYRPPGESNALVQKSYVLGSPDNILQLAAEAFEEFRVFESAIDRTIAKLVGKKS